MQETAMSDSLRSIIDEIKDHEAEFLILVPVFLAHEKAIACVKSLATTLPDEAVVLIVDDCSPDEGLAIRWEQVKNDFSCSAHFARLDENHGFGGVVNLVGNSIDRGLIIVNSDVILTPGWYEDYLEAVNSRPDVATVSCFTNSGTILSMPFENRPVGTSPNGSFLTEYSDEVRSKSQKVLPVIPTAVGHVLLITRLAWNVCEGFSPDYARGYGEEVDFSLRAAERGLANILADSVYVHHFESASFSQVPEWTDEHRKENDNKVYSRFPYHLGRAERLSTDIFSGFGLSKDQVRLTPDRIRIAVDGTCFGGPWNGTQENALQVIVGLKKKFPQLRVISFPSISLETSRFLLDNGIALDVVHGLNERLARYDIIYRPFQITTPQQLDFLKAVSDRVIVSILDMIAYHNVAYHESYGSYLGYRNLQRLVFETVEGTTWISETAYDNCVRDYPRLKRFPSAISYIGLDGIDSAPAQPIIRETNRAELVGENDIFVPGVRYLHKGHDIAVRIAERMWEMGWEGKLVLSGNTPKDGSSLTRLLASLIRGNFGGSNTKIIHAGSLSAEDYQNLVCRVGVVLCPSLAEGFGIVPFDSAQLGTPCLTPEVSCFKEILPVEARALGDLDVEECALTILEVLNSKERSEMIVDSITQQSLKFKWSDSIENVATLINETIQAPRNPVKAIWGESSLVGLEGVVAVPPKTKQKFVGRFLKSKASLG